MNKHQDALQKQYATIQSSYDDAAKSMIASGEAIMKYPGTVLLGQMGIIKSPEANNNDGKSDDSTDTIPEPFTLLDNACGPGLIAGVLQEEVDRKVLEKSRIMCADVNENFVNILKDRAVVEDWAGVETAVLDAQNPGFPDASFDFSTVNYAMHIIPDPDAVLVATKKLLKPGGVFGFTTMHSSNKGWQVDLRTAFDSLPFPTEPLDEAVPMTVNKSGFASTSASRDALTCHGFVDVDVRVIEHKSPVLSGQDYIDRFDMMIQMMIDAYWSAETKELMKKEEEKQGFELKAWIKKHLDEKYGGKRWDLEWKMLIATGKKPAE